MIGDLADPGCCARFGPPIAIVTFYTFMAMEALPLPSIYRDPTRARRFC